MVEVINVYFQEAQIVPKMFNLWKIMPRHIIIKLLKIKLEEKILKAEKNHTLHTEEQYHDSKFSSETVGAGRQ